MSVTPSRIARCVIATLPFLLCACVYHDYPAPQIQGTLTQAGEPLAGIAVSITEFDHQGQELSIYTGQRFGGVFSGYSGNDRVKLSCKLSPVGAKNKHQEGNPLCESIPGNAP